MKRFVIFLNLWALGMVATTCGPGVGEGPYISAENTPLSDGKDSGSPGESMAAGDTDTDADSDTDNDTDTDSDADADADADGGMDTGSEIDTGNGCPTDLFNDEMIFYASDLLKDSRFVAMSNHCLLLKRDGVDGIQTMVVFTDPWNTGHVDTVVGMISDNTPVDLTCNPDTLEATVLFETDGGSTIYRVYGEEEELVELKGLEVLATRHLKGITRFLRTSDGGIDRVCAYGEGIYCSEGASGWSEWEEAAAPEEGIRFNDMSLLLIEEAWAVIAVGTNGRVQVEHPDGFHVLDSGTNEELLTVSGAGDIFIAAGQNGVIVHGTVESTEQRTLFEEDIVSLHWREARYFKGVTADGTVFEGSLINGDIAVCTDTIEAAEAPLDGLFWFCEAYENYLVLTETHLFGEYDCGTITVV
jgi:hypothetical protein